MTTTHRITTTAAAILSLAAAGAPTATAMPVRADPPTGPNRAPATVQTTSAPPPVVRIQTPSGFDWGDAGSGAAGGVAFAMLGLGGGLVISHHRPRRTRHTTALPS
jgi:hypothetical protein